MVFAAPKHPRLFQPSVEGLVGRFELPGGAVSGPGVPLRLAGKAGAAGAGLQVGLGPELPVRQREDGEGNTYMAGYIPGVPSWASRLHRLGDLIELL